MAPQQQQPSRLVRHFQLLSPDNESEGWRQLWDSNDEHLWDRGRPSPPLVDFVEKDCHGLLQHNAERRPRAFVPGCGKGYDVAMLARHGFEVVGLEVSETGVQVARRYVEGEFASLSPVQQDGATGNQAEPTKDSVGEVKIVHGDFFGREWESTCAIDGQQCQFDLIYDYTFLCALNPGQRRAWADRMRDLLAPQGILVCLEFPLFKEPSAPGPPWPLQGAYWDLLVDGGDGLQPVVENKSRDVGSRDRQFERVLYLQPEESHEQGRGTDMLSVWRLKRIESVI